MPAPPSPPAPPIDERVERLAAMRRELYADLRSMDVLTIPQVCHALDIGRRAYYRLVEAERLVPVRYPNGSVRVPADQVEKHLDEMRVDFGLGRREPRPKARPRTQSRVA